jgi:multiple sugar transport system substrate-binding protein
MHLSRRHLLAAAGVTGLHAALAGCGFGPGSSDESDASGTLSFTTWGTDAELAALRAVIAEFEAANSGASIALNAVPYEQMFTNIDAQLQAGQAPDLFRVPYYLFGSYAGAGQLLDLGPHLPSDFADRFTDAAWAAVQSGASPFGVPHHTDTSAILYNRSMFDEAGIGDVPTTAEDAWTWDEFAALATTLREQLPSERFPMAYNWQGNGVTRWLSWLFQADGRFLQEDLVTPAIDSEAGRAAIEFTSSFFAQGWVPAANSVQSSTYASDLWYAETVAMTWAGAFLLPDADATLDFEWGATFAPRNVRGGGDFGGNAVVATSGADPDLAVAFLDFLTQADQMRAFCEASSLLPTRADLVDDGIEFVARPDLSEVFLGQAAVVQPEDAGQVASPDMASIITVLKDQLEASFVGGQGVDATLAAMTDGIAAATGG